MFDDVIIVDWSAAATPRRGKDSIWIAHVQRESPRGHELLVNPPTRQAAIDVLVETIERLRGEQRKVVVGVDFSLGYPRGTAEVLATAYHYQVERASDLAPLVITHLLNDDADNSNNRFEVADAINRATGQALFWGKPSSARFGNLSALSPTKRCPAGLDPSSLPEFRLVEAFVPYRLASNWQLLGAGSVGSQVLTGLASLCELRRRIPGVVVWPFERAALQHSPVIIVEVWPNLVATPLPDQPVRDAWQVLSAARFFAAQSASQWHRYFHPLSIASFTPEEQRSILDEEGWIFGVV
jgi:precorrin-8X/cobalt-precorrin-8 methylmutase